MPVYEISGDEISHLSYGRLADLKKGERKDFLKLMRENIEVISDDLLLVSDDADKWNKSEKIDLLAIDKNKNLVVIEVLDAKDDEEQDLQVVRYGTLVSKMTFAKLVSVYGDHLTRVKSGIAAKKSILDHWESSAGSVNDSDSLNLRIFLVSHEFSEGTIATVEWFQNGSLDVRCIEVASFEFTDRSIVDIVQIVPQLDPAEVAKNLSKKPSVITKKTEPKSEPTAAKEEVKKPEPVEAKGDDPKPAPVKPQVEKTKPAPAKAKAPAPVKAKEAESKPASATAKAKAPAPAAPKPTPTKTKEAVTKPAPAKTKESMSKSTPAKAKESTPKSIPANANKSTPKTAVTKSAPSKGKKPAKKPAPVKTVKVAAKSKGNADASKSAKKPQQLDRAKYIVSLNGKKQPATAKRRAVLQALSHVLKSGVKPEKLPKRIAGTDDILVSVSGNVNGENFKKLALVERKKHGRSFDPKRYFCQDDELLKINGRTYAIINQWTLEAFTELMELVDRDFPNLKITYTREEK